MSRDSIDVDTRELDAFVVELGRVSARSLPVVDAVMKKGIQQIKEEMVEDASNSDYFEPIARTLTYDSDYRVNQVAYELGPDRDRSGAAHLANIAYFGGANGGGGTLDLDGPLRREEPRTMAALDKALGELL